MSCEIEEQNMPSGMDRISHRYLQGVLKSSPFMKGVKEASHSFHYLGSGNFGDCYLLMAANRKHTVIKLFFDKADMRSEANAQNHLEEMNRLSSNISLDQLCKWFEHGRFTHGPKSIYYAIIPYGGVTLTSPVCIRLDRNAFMDSYIALMRTMENLHLEGLTHTDIKPENMAVSESSTVHLFDWGNAYFIKGLEPSHVTNHIPCCRVAPSAVKRKVYRITQGTYDYPLKDDKGCTVEELRACDMFALCYCFFVATKTFFRDVSQQMNKEFIDYVSGCMYLWKPHLFHAHDVFLKRG